MNNKKMIDKPLFVIKKNQNIHYKMYERDNQHSHTKQPADDKSSNKYIENIRKLSLEQDEESVSGDADGYECMKNDSDLNNKSDRSQSSPIGRNNDPNVFKLEGLDIDHEKKILPIVPGFHHIGKNGEQTKEYDQDLKSRNKEKKQTGSRPVSPEIGISNLITLYHISYDEKHTSFVRKCLMYSTLSVYVVKASYK